MSAAVNLHEAEPAWNQMTLVADPSEVAVAKMSITEAERRLKIVNDLLDRAGILAYLEDLIAAARKSNRGAKPTVSTRTLLTGILLALLDDRPPQLQHALAALARLPRHLRMKAGFLRPARPFEREERGRVWVEISYSSYSRALNRLAAALGDPRVEPTNEGRERRATSDSTAHVLDAILDASVTKDVNPLSGAIDSTAIYGHVNQRTKRDEIQDSADPDVDWYVKRNKEISVLGYSHSAVIAQTVKGKTVVLAMELQSGNAEDSTTGVDLIKRSIKRRGALRLLQQMAADKAYSKGRSVFDAAHAAGIYVVFDPNEHQRGPQAVIDGHPIVDGAAYCPCLPEELMNLGPAPSVFNDVDPDPYQQAIAHREIYRLQGHGRAKPNGSHRVSCPALTGQAQCPRKPVESARPGKSKSLPLILPDESTPFAAACTQQTKSMPGQVDGLQLQPQYPYGTSDWREAYSKPRSRVEGAFGNLKTGQGQMRRGAVHVTGLSKTGLMLALHHAVENLRACDEFPSMTHRASLASQALRATEEDFTPEGWQRHLREITAPREGRAPPNGRNRNG